MIKLNGNDCENLVAFIKDHDRLEIPVEVWDICMRMEDALEEDDE